MNRRTIALLSVCFLLAVTTLTVRYIEQEKENIKARVGGADSAQEKSTSRMPSAREPLARISPVNEMPPPVQQGTSVKPSAMGATSPPLTVMSTVAEPSPGSFVPAGGRQVPAPPGGKKESEVVRGTNPVPDRTISTALSDLTTPLDSEEPAAAPEAHGGSEADAREAQAAVVDEKSVPGDAGEGSAHAGKTLAVEEQQAGQVAADGERGEKIQEEEDSAAAEDESGGEEEEAVGEGAPSEGEEATEEGQAPAEGEVQQEEGATGRKEETPYED